MYLNFDIKKDKDLILLNYYIRTHLEDSKIEISTRDIAIELDISKSKSHRLLQKLLELGIIEKIELPNKNTNKTIYQYCLSHEVTNETDSENLKTSKSSNSIMPRETEIGTQNEMVFNEKKTELENIFNEIFPDVKNIQANTVLKIDGVEKLETSLFKTILEEAALKANKNPFNYAKTTILNTLKDNILTLEGRIEKQQQRNTQAQKNNSWNYIEDSSDVDFEELAKLTRR